jgi:hypothetical protein
MAFLINDPLAMATDGMFSLTEGGGGDTVAATVEAVIAPSAFSAAVDLTAIAGLVEAPTITGTVTLEQIPAVITLPAFSGEAQ